MIINEDIHASWDETTNFILLSRVQRTRLEQLALSLADGLANAVEQNELSLNMKNPRQAFFTTSALFPLRESTTERNGLKGVSV